MNKTVTSKFSFTNVYLMYGFMLAILIFGVYLITHSGVILHTKFGSNMSAAYVALLFTIIPLVFFYFNQKYLLKIYVEDDSIILKSLFWHCTYSIGDIKNIDLFARRSLGLLSNQQKSNGIIITTSNRSYFLNNSYYQNLPKIKAAIYQNFKILISKKIDNDSKIKSLNTNPSNLIDRKFYNNFLLSPDVLAFIIAFIILILLYKNESTVFKVCITLGILFMVILLFIAKANYFLLSSNQLIVKNQLLPFKKIAFDFDNIENVVIEKVYRQSNTLRINTKDFYSKKFQAGGLWDSTWQRFIQELKTSGIEVENDTYL